MKRTSGSRARQSSNRPSTGMPPMRSPRSSSSFRKPATPIGSPRGAARRDRFGHEEPAAVTAQDRDQSHAAVCAARAETLRPAWSGCRAPCSVRDRRRRRAGGRIPFDRAAAESSSSQRRQCQASPGAKRSPTRRAACGSRRSCGGSARAVVNGRCRISRSCAVAPRRLETGGTMSCAPRPTSVTSSGRTMSFGWSFDITQLIGLRGRSSASMPVRVRPPSVVAWLAAVQAARSVPFASRTGGALKRGTASASRASSPAVASMRPLAGIQNSSESTNSTQSGAAHCRDHVLGAR